MKKIILVSVVWLACLSAKAQLRYGVEGGVNFSSLNNPSAFSGWHYKTGYHANSYLEIPIKYGFSVQPEVMYSQEGAYLQADGERAYINFNFFYVPVLLKYNHSSGLYVEAGPQFGSLTSASITDGTGAINADVKSFFMHNNFNWVAGLGYNFRFGLGVHVRYNQGISNLAKNSSGDGLPVGNLKTRDIQAGAFYNIARLFKQKTK